MKKFVGDITILHMCTKNDNHMRYSSWDTNWDRIFCHFGPFFAFLTLCPPTTHKTKLKKIMKKTSREVIILNLRNKKTRSYDVCLFSYRVFAQTIFCHFRPVFAFLPHYWLQKLKFGKNVKKYLDILLHMCAINQDHMFRSWDMKFNLCFCYLWHFFFALFTPLTPWKWKYQKWKKLWRYHRFTQVYQKSWSSAILFHVSDVIFVFILGYQVFFQTLFYSQ